MSCCTLYRDGGARTVTERMCAVGRYYDISSKADLGDIFIVLSHTPTLMYVPNLYEYLFSAERKGKYSEECGKQSSSGEPLTSIVWKKILWKSMMPKTTWVQTFFKISSSVLSRTKTLIQVWNYLRVSKWQSFHFWMNNPFKGKKVLTLKWNLKLTLNRAATKLFLFWLIYRLIFRLISKKKIYNFT